MAQGRPAAKAFVEIFADNRKMLRGLAQASAAWRTFGTQLSSSLRGVAQASTAAGAVIAVGLARSTAAFADEEAVARRFATFFSTNMNQATETAERFASTMKLNKSRVKDALVTGAAYWKGFGKTQNAALGYSERMLAITYDLAAFKGIGTEDAFYRLLSALAGSAQSMDHFGIDLRRTAVDAEFMRMAKSMDEFRGVTSATATEVQAGMARLRIIEQSLGRQGSKGHAVRNLDLLVSRWQQLKDQVLSVLQVVGRALTPVVKAWADAVAEVQKKLVELLSTARGTDLIRNLPAMIAGATALTLAFGAIGRLLAIIVPLSLTFMKATMATARASATFGGNTLRRAFTAIKALGSPAVDGIKARLALNARLTAQLREQAAIMARADRARVDTWSAVKDSQRLAGELARYEAYVAHRAARPRARPPGKRAKAWETVSTAIDKAVRARAESLRRAQASLAAIRASAGSDIQNAAVGMARARQTIAALKAQRAAIVPDILRGMARGLPKALKSGFALAVQTAIVTGVVNGFIAARAAVQSEISKNYFAGMGGALAEAFQTGDLENVFALVFLGFKSVWDSATIVFKSIIDEFYKAFQWLIDTLRTVWAGLSKTVTFVQQAGEMMGANLQIQREMTSEGKNWLGRDRKEYDERRAALMADTWFPNQPAAGTGPTPTATLTANQKDLQDLIMMLGRRREDRQNSLAADSFAQALERFGLWIDRFGQRTTDAAAANDQTAARLAESVGTFFNEAAFTLESRGGGLSMERLQQDTNRELEQQTDELKVQTRLSQQLVQGGQQLLAAVQSLPFASAVTGGLTFD